MYPAKVYVIGDIHGRFQPIRDFYLRNKINMIKENRDTKYDNVLILLGDSGLNYFLNERDDKLKQKLDSYPFTYFIVRGNHEERACNLALKNPDDWEWQEFFGGPVLVEKKYPYIKYAADIPEIYHIPYWTGDYSEGTEENDWNDEGIPIVKTWTTFVLPGAYSVDKDYRLMMGYSWFKDEQMTEEEKDSGLYDLEHLGYKCDIVLSHTCPCIFEPTDLFLPMIDQSKVDKSMERYLGQIEYMLDYKLWMWGHYHAFRDYPRTDGKKKIMLFNQEAIELQQVFEDDIVNKL